MRAEIDDTVVIGCEALELAVPSACSAPLVPADIQTLANSVGDEDATLEPEDLRNADLNERWDANQLSEDCTSISCSLIVLVFVDDEETTIVDPDSGLQVVQAGGENNWVCDTSAEDADCDAAVGGDGDRVVVANLIAAPTTSAGNVEGVDVQQEAVSDSFDVFIVGGPVDVQIMMPETIIQTSGSSAGVTECTQQAITGDLTSVFNAPNATVVFATVTDDDGTELTRIPVTFSIPAADDDEVATIGETTGNTIDPATQGAATAAYAVICGGTGTGSTGVTAGIVVAGEPEFDGGNLTVVGEPASVALAASPAVVNCGAQSSTVTATITDSDGNPVADGVDVNFSVVALGTASPINTRTRNGTASSTITPLSSATAGVTVVVSAGDAQASIRIDCAASSDADGDGVENAVDNCPSLWNPFQQNHDGAPLATAGLPDDTSIPNGDALGDACDNDDDNDWLNDWADGAGCNGSGALSHISRDSDSDRVIDGAECALGANPADSFSRPAAPFPDADGDRLGDAFESGIGFNPQLADTDGDRIPDGIEYKGYATSPTNTDTDGDGCPDGREIASVNDDSRPVVNSLDLAIVAMAYGRTDRPVQDVDKNRVINSIDLLVVASLYGGVISGCGPP